MGKSIGNAAAVALAMAACGFRGIEAQERPTKLDTLHVEVVSRADPNLPATTRSIQTISAEEISALPVRTVAELLDWATGVDVIARSPAQGDLSIRGSGFEQVVVMVNGVRMSDPQTGHFDLDLAVPLQSVERIEVLRGAASAIYGADAVGGVVNVVTRTGGDPFSGRIQGGSWGTVKVAASGGAGEAGGSTVNVGGAISRSDGHREGTDYETTQLFTSISRPAGSGRISAEFGASRKHFGAQDFYAPYPSYERTGTYTASLGWEGGGGPVFWETRISVRRHGDEFTLVRDDPSIYLNEHTSSQGGAMLLGRYSSGERLDFAFGGELFLDVLRSTNLGDRTERRGAVFAEALLGAVGTAVLTFGGRADVHQGFGTFLSPSLSGSVNVLPNLRFRAALGRSFRAPTWTERYYRDPVNIGQPDLGPERAWSGEFGADLVGGTSFDLSATVFVRRANSLIDWARPVSAQDADPWETRNVENATFRGVEVEVGFTGPLDLAWTLGGTALAVDAEEIVGFRSKYALRPLTEQLTLGAERAFGSSALGRVRLRHGRRKGEESYRRIDFRISLRVGVGWLHVDGLNVTDFDYPDVTGARAPGRAFLVGYSLTAK